MKPVNSCKRVWVFLVFFLPVLANAQINLGDIQNISDTEGTPSDEQNFVNVGNNYYVVWNKWGDIAFSKSEDAGQTWSAAETVYSAFDYGANYPVVAAEGETVMIFYYRNTSGDSQIGVCDVQRTNRRGV